jgi:1-deoxy-D-xylulose-5-phosphate reductoisomerase
LGYPQRLASGVADLDFTEIGAFTFAKPEAERYPLLQLAIDACWQGQAATTTLNAANEVAVAAFLHEQISFGEIAEICTETLQKANISPLNDIEAVLNCDAEARRIARNYIQRGC